MGNSGGARPPRAVHGARSIAVSTTTIEPMAEWIGVFGTTGSAGQKRPLVTRHLLQVSCQFRQSAQVGLKSGLAGAVLYPVAFEHSLPAHPRHVRRDARVQRDRAREAHPRSRDMLRAEVTKNCCSTQI